LDAYTLFTEGWDELWVFRGESPEAGPRAIGATDVIPLNRHFLDLPFSHLVKKLAETNLSAWSLGPAKDIEEGDHDQPNDQPEC
jgi:hypothetical protein